MKEIDVTAPLEIDFEKIGLIVGLEFHQQMMAPYNDEAINIQNGSKLFCSCPALLRDDEADFIIDRKLRPVSGETGEIDIATQFERLKQAEIIYEGFHDTNCLVELDEEPILPINSEALFRSLAIAKKIFNLELVDEILVNRKAIIDGSNTSGFQRTAMIAYGNKNSFIKVNGKRISVYQANLEEDSAKNVGKAGSVRKFRLDRLGIPLIEIATGPDIRSPEETIATALRIGELLRTTGFVKRGQGTIRQDLNVSVRLGTRIEIKGVSELDLLPTYVKNEATRQLRMREIVSEMKARKLTKRKVSTIKGMDLTKIFNKCQAKFVQKALKKKQHVIGAKLPSFKGLLEFELQENYRLGTEISEISKVTGGVGGILHSDELPKFGIIQEEVDAVRSALKCNTNDGFFLIIGPDKDAFKAILGVKSTMMLWLDAKTLVPEVRAPRADGTSGFLRPLPGKARMYPETDSEPIFVDKELRNRIENQEFEMPEDREKRYITSLGVSKELANQLALHPKNYLFEEVISKTKVSSNLVASTLLSTIIDLRRQGHDVTQITDDRFAEMFEAIENGTITNTAIEATLVGIIESTGQKSIDEIVSSLGLEKVDESEIEKTIADLIVKNADLIKDRGMGSMGTLMRLAMEDFGGKADGKLVSNLVRLQIQAYLKS